MPELQLRLERLLLRLDRMGMRVAMEARRHGLVIRPLGDVMVIMPPLILTVEEIDRLLEITFECIRKITESR